MAISFVGSHVGTHAATSAQTVNFSSLLNESGGTPTLQQGDLVLVAVENASTVDRTQAQLTPSGYTAAHTDDYRNDSNDSNFLVSYKFMGGTPDTTVSIPASNATTAGVAYAIYVFRGVNTTAGPFDATTVVTGNNNTGVANAAAITPVTAGAWIVVFGGAAVAAGAVFTNPAGMSTTTNHFRSATITSTTNDANIAGAIYTGWTSGAYDPAVFGGSTSTNTGSWSAVTMALKPIVTHANTGSLTGQGSTVAGSANRASPAVTHATTGALTGQGSTVAGTSARTRQHAATGVLAGQGAAVAGASARTRQHGTSGTLQGQGADIVGSAARASGTVSHATTGVLAGQGAIVAGSSARTRQHAATGALEGQGAEVAGGAARLRAFATSGVLAGQGSLVSGAANHASLHVTTGALSGPGSAIAGDAARTRVHATSGAITGPGAIVEGEAARAGAPVSHATSGDLVGQGSVVSGAASAGLVVTTGGSTKKRRVSFNPQSVDLYELFKVEQNNVAIIAALEMA